MDKIAELVRDLESVLAEIPTEHRGILFERVFKRFHPQENTRRLELAFAQVWAQKNAVEFNPLLQLLMFADSSDPRTEYVPQDEREWQVAYLTAATLVQWLATSVGCSFLREAFEKGGGRLTYELPKVDA